MRTSIAGLCLATAMLSLSPSLAQAAPATDLQLKIFPLECSIDVLSTGPEQLVQLDPEDCLPKPPIPPDEQPLPGQPDSGSSSTPQLPSALQRLFWPLRTPLEQLTNSSLLAQLPPTEQSQPIVFRNDSTQATSSLYLYTIGALLLLALSVSYFIFVHFIIHQRRKR